MAATGVTAVTALTAIMDAYRMTLTAVVSERGARGAADASGESLTACFAPRSKASCRRSAAGNLAELRIIPSGHAVKHTRCVPLPVLVVFNAVPLSMRRSRHRASPFFLDRRRDRIRLP